MKTLVTENIKNMEKKEWKKPILIIISIKDTFGGDDGSDDDGNWGQS